MEPSPQLKALILVLTCLSAGKLAAASEGRPRLENYPSSYEFLQALQAWNHNHPDGAVTGLKASEPVTAQVPATIDPTSELAPPPIAITGPENLDHAVEQARFISHPNYKEKIRYHRSTHISFPLPSIDGKDMSMASVNDALGLGEQKQTDAKVTLERLANVPEQDRLNSQDQTKEASTPSMAMPAIPSSVMPSGMRVRADITVSGH